MARWPRLFGVRTCVEASNLTSIREAIGSETGLSCSRTGAPGVWSKDTILLIDKTSVEPLYVVKAGTGKAVDALLSNEANWLRALRDHKPLASYVPQLFAHRSGSDLSFVAQSVLSGTLDLSFGDPQVEFLRKLQAYSRKPMHLEESRLYRNQRMRLRDMESALPAAWHARFNAGLQNMEQSFSGKPISLTAAHNDFTPWNVRVQGGLARVFDWEYADQEQLPMFDPLHFALMPMALGGSSAVRMLREMRKTIELCSQWFGAESCYKAEAQALAYLMNVCTLYLWSVGGTYAPHPVLDGYAGLIDHLCSA
jgi:hypothetical protein